MKLTPAMKRALRKVDSRKFCAHWLIPKNTLRALLRRRIIVPCGFYSVCRPSNQAWLHVTYDEPEKAFD
jgi:cell division FtsZ-interacting protein ZapD